jgi:hypothetical protein
MPTRRDDYTPTHITTVTTTVIAGVATKFISIVVNSTAAGTITVYNAATSVTCSSTNAIAVLKASVAEGDYNYFVKLSTGLIIVTAGASDITVTSGTA